MILLNYPSPSPIVKTWKEKLETLSVGHQFIQQDELEEPVLTENDKTVIGEHAITNYLNDLELFVKEWRAPICGV